MKIKKTTPILCVKSIEESLPLWTKQLGYKKTVEVPHKEYLGFVILKNGDLELMLQTEASVQDDLPQVVKHFEAGKICLYSDVDSIEEAVKALKGFDVVIPMRTTFYGATEIWIRDQDGFIHGYAEHKK